MDAETSKIVADGMNRLCEDFNERIINHDFKKSGRRAWKRERNGYLEKIHFHRGGSSYGRPINNSVDIRVELTSNKLIKETLATQKFIDSEQYRKRDGYAYHHRFNAKSWSTYDRCLDELMMFIRDHAEPWFDKQISSNNPFELFMKIYRGNA